LNFITAIPPSKRVKKIHHEKAYYSYCFACRYYHLFLPATTYRIIRKVENRLYEEKQTPGCCRLILAAGGSTLLLGTFVLQSTEVAYVSIWEGSSLEYESETNYAPAILPVQQFLEAVLVLIIASR
jgi:hypothetical protein